ncbi:MAG: NAD(P)-dependent oxidoreductase [Porticoccaceae bacterium]|nr:MAG: NAD(P)-dependent oxidoreductase [Porticoccaceae bacterium]
MKILLLGATGQVGRALMRTLSTVGDVFPLTRRHCDLRDLRRLNRLLDQEDPDIVVNAAAYTAVDRAEEEPEEAERLNHRLPATLAAWCDANAALLVDFSTDYVFDGSARRPWRESDPRRPLNVYGASKARGLEAIEKSGCQYLVFLVSWVYARQGRNFPNTILRLARERAEIQVVADQVGTPTPAGWIARQVAVCLEQVLHDPDKAGLYNLAPSGSTSWWEFARLVVAEARARGEALALAPEGIRPVASRDYPTPARRPAYSVLDTERLATTFGIVPADWRQLYRELVRESPPVA